MRKRIRLTESDLHRIVNRSVKQVLREADDVRSEFENGNRRDTYGNGQIVDTYSFDENKIKEQVYNFRDAIQNIQGAITDARNMDITAMINGLKREDDLQRALELLRGCLWGEMPQKLNEASTLLSGLAWKFTPNRRNGFKSYSEQLKSE